MSGSIVRALNWDNGYEQQFLAVNPLGDEVILYQTKRSDPQTESNDMMKLTSRGDFENIHCLSYSKSSRGVVGVGSINGYVSIFDINSSNSSILKLRAKQNRPCNDISFNHKNLIVTGFDKGRQDNSLQIWNIEQYASQSPNDHIQLPMSSYLPNEAILSTTFYPENDNILCGSYKFLREIDLRTDQPIFQMATKCTLGITIDPFQNHLFQSFSEDGSLSIWDRRMLLSKSKNVKAATVISESPLLRFPKLLNDNSSRKNQSPCVRYSSIRRGEFAAVFNGDLIRRWNTQIVPPTNTTYDPKNKKESNNLSNLKYQASQLYKPNEESLFVSIVLDVKTDYERVISFDYSPDIVSSTSSNLVCMRQSGSVFRMPATECVESLDFNSFNEFSICGPEGTSTKFIDESDNFKFTEMMQMKERPKKLTDFSLSDDFRKYSVADSLELDSTVDDESVLGHHQSGHLQDDEEYIPLNKFLDASNVVKNDICYVIRRRALMGYGIDYEKNVKILENIDTIDGQMPIRNTWKWIGLAKKSLDKGTMISDGIDLGYLGVLGIWKGVESLKYQNRSAKDRGEINDTWFAHAVKLIVSSKGKKTASISIISNSEKKAQRKLCLIVSGWYQADTEFEENLNILINLGFETKAAGWAVFHDDVERAIEIFANSKSERLRLIGTAIAGYLAYKNSNINSPWKDQCRKMASELDDPYLRAIFAYIADNDWWDVLDEHSLPLRERLGVALSFLSDKDLNVYLNRIADSVIKRGELEGLILTGLTSDGIDLLQSYVDRTQDVQTAALISSFACPRYFVDERVKHWVDSYRQLLNSWGLFNIRAKFDVSRTKLSKNMQGTTTLKSIPKQVYLQCNRCNKNISKKSTMTNTNLLIKQFNKLNGSKVINEEIKGCPHCGAPLPRCSICLLTLGTPLPLQPNEKLIENTLSNKVENRFREWFSFCLSCNHGSHAHHAEEWFSKHYVCPVPDCNCRCNSK